jgi:3-dehydroquinate synthase
VLIDRGALRRLGAFARELTPGATRAAVVTEPRVAALYGAAVQRSLRRAGFAVTALRVPRGERAKQPAELAKLWTGLAASGVGRRDLVVALGGGSVGDLAGFAAATWLRGVAWVVVPSTLLAQVDSSVGGKTAIDLTAGKNLVGAFHQPRGVLVDPGLLATLPARQRRAGLAEIVKIGMATDVALFRWLERHAGRLAAGDPETLAAAVTRAIRAKARVVTRDEREREGGARTALNFGHTLGHAIEAARGYRGPLHGEAVAIGMRAAARMSVAVAGLSTASCARLDDLLDALGLPRRMPPTSLARLVTALARDKKRDARNVRWVLTPEIGRASVPRSISGRLMRAALLEAGARA